MFAAKNTTTSTTPPATANKGTNTFIQPKLNIGKPGDKYEVEADKAADQIVAKNNDTRTPFFPATPSIQKQSEEDIQQQPVVDSITTGIQLKEDNAIQKAEEEEVQQQEESGQEELQMMTDQASAEQMPEPTLQTKETSDITPTLPTIQQTANEDVQRMEEEEIQEKEEEEVQTLQKQASGDEGNTASIENDLNASKGGGSPLDSNTKSEMESGFGTDFSGVRVHNDNTAVQMNQQLGSQAFANGNDIYFNEGKYNPGSDSGKHLLAHELTHTVQQGASVQTKMIQKAGEEPATELGAPTTVVDITNGLNLSKDWLDYIEENPKTKKIDVSVKIGAQYTGTITLKKLGKAKEGEKQKFELASSKTGRHLDVHGMQFLNPLQQAEIYPILVLNNFGEEQKTSGFLSIKKKEVAVTKNAVGIIDGINENLEAMSFLGLSPIKGTQGLENKFESGGLHFKANDLSVGIDGYIEASGSIGITNSAFTFELSSTVDVAGLASGEFNLSRGEDGKLSGKANISADIANVNANLVIEYDKGAVTIQGTGKMSSEKFSGEITLLVTDAAKSKQMMNAALGVETMDAEAAAPAPATPKEAVPKTKGNQVLAGWGEVQATITPWLEGTAKIGIDSEGHVTIVGEIVVPNEIELMEQRGKKVDIFSIEIRAGYGIPLVGQVFLFASVGMFVNAGFGPLVLKDVGFTGTYSTDPSVLQQFSITGTLGINAFAIIGLEAEAGVGVTLLGHDLKAGVNVTAAAGLRAYAEATPTFQYEESASPQGGKIGESRLKGHFEAAAQLFLQLSGALFYELDSPWWSPAPDGREEFPLGEVQYPIGDSMGIGADIDWLVGSPDAPELTFSPVEFDPDKFTADVMADPPPKKMGKADAAPAGEWKGEPGGEQGKDPKVTGDGKGLPENSKKKEDLKKLPDEQKYMRSLDEMSKLEKAKPKPTYAVVQAKADKVKKKYGLDKIQLKDKQDDSVSVFVKHAKEDNGKHLLKVPLMSEAERLLLLHSAMTDLRAREKKATGEDGTMEESGAKDMITTWLKAHPVVESAKVIDGKETWDYFIDIGDKSETEKGKLKKVEENVDSDKIKEENKNATDVEITDADRKEHVKIAKEIKTKLVASKTLKDESFNKFYDRIKLEGKTLENKYQPRPKKGINIDITVGSFAEEKKDGDLDFKIRIYPNDTLENAEVTYEEGQEITNESLVAELAKLPAGVSYEALNSAIRSLNGIVESESLNYVFKKLALKTATDKDHFIIEITEVIKTKNEDDGRKVDVETTNVGTVKMKRVTKKPDSKSGAPDISQFLVEAEARFSDGSKAAIITEAKTLHKQLRLIEGNEKISDLSAYITKLNKLSGLLQELSTEDTELPTTTYDFESDAEGKAVKAVAEKLSTKTGPGTAPQANIIGWNFVTGNLNNADDKLWVRLHLINEKKFGGRGGAVNLVPGTKNNNSDHLANFENKLKNWLDTKQDDNSYRVAGMEANVSRYGAGQFDDSKHHHNNVAIDGVQPKSEWYADKIEFTAKEYVENSGNWTKGSKNAVDPMTLNIPLPNFNAAKVPALPTITGKQLELIAGTHSSNVVILTKESVKNFLRREVFTGHEDLQTKLEAKKEAYGIDDATALQLPGLVKEIIKPNQLTF